MAEINTSEGGSKKKHGKKRSKKISTKVDLTPMVDLAFLLITFFMLTTTLNKPNAMQLTMPKKDPNVKPTKINEELLLNLILDKDKSVWYYEGSTAAGLQKTGFTKEKGIRDVIYKKQQWLQKNYGNKDTMICIIKYTDEAEYNGIVSALDEMDITGVKRFAIQDIQPLEVQAIKNGGDANTVSVPVKK